MFMWYFEYSYDSTAVLKPKRSVVVTKKPFRTLELMMYWSGGR